MKALPTLLAFLITVAALAQTGDSVIIDNEMFEQVIGADEQKDKDWVYMVVEEMPEFPGGYEALYNYLKDNLKYPEEGKKKKIEGVVYLGFIIDRQGKLDSIQIQKGISRSCDNEAVRLIQAMPNWKPGMQGGKPVNVRYSLPIRFRLE